MRVPDEILKSVFYLCIKQTRSGLEQFHYGGTGFWVSIKSQTHDDILYSYLITAKHNVEKAQQHGSDLYLRLNRKGGGAQHLKVKAPWIFPEKDGVDLAIIEWAAPEEFDVKSIGSESFTTDLSFEEESIGIGDELFIVGLFTQRYGSRENQPIVRSGVIAAMPTEPLQDSNTGFKYDAYLAEVRSLGGLSGSPVFVGFPHYYRPSNIKRSHKKYFYLLGVIRGHWDLKKRQVDLDFADDELGQVNMGIATVTPVQELDTMLNSEELKKVRAKLDREIAAQRAPLDSEIQSAEPKQSDKA